MAGTPYKQVATIGSRQGVEVEVPLDGNVTPSTREH
jgi:hypothetical protein